MYIIKIMANIKVVKFNEYSGDLLSYTPPKSNTSGGKSVNILNKEQKKAFYLSSPLLMTWGISDYDGNQRYEMSLQFPGPEYHSDKTRTFLTVMGDFESKIKKDAITNSKEWFGKKIESSEVIEALFTPILKYPKNKETGEPDHNKSPSIRAKVPCYDGEWKTNIYNVNYEKIFPVSGKSLTPMDFISKTDKVACVLQCGGIWFANGKFGVTWRLHQAVTQPRDDNSQSCQIELDDDDKKELTTSVFQADQDKPAAVELSTQVESDDDTVGESDDEPEPEPEPEPPKKKKMVARKKAAA